jgi:KipI family sensor histidine kinase inhibitor
MPNAMKIIPAHARPLGDAAIVIDFGASIDRSSNARVMAARQAVDAAELTGVRETVPTFSALTIHFDPAQTTQRQLLDQLAEMMIAGPVVPPAAKTWHVPVLYDGPDLADIAAAVGMVAEEVATLHASRTYHVYMLGFLPGFAYLGDLPEALRLPRLTTPRTRVPAGSVAIADQLTAVYPSQSPGGWRLIGRTPLRLFNADAQPPSLFSAGDSVSFHAVDAGEFQRLTESHL